MRYEVCVKKLVSNDLFVIFERYIDIYDRLWEFLFRAEQREWHKVSSSVEYGRYYLFQSLSEATAKAVEIYNDKMELTRKEKELKPQMNKIWFRIP